MIVASCIGFIIAFVMIWFYLWIFMMINYNNDNYSSNSKIVFITAYLLLWNQWIKFIKEAFIKSYTLT